ncbi:hypothetical protein M501DRAFT_1002487 [Patellaria atrata CBS 101060]|uniref:DM2 domain-containing protein n=1 Tax=Patellaria atrata CBS 101060 TaxID=1346257 RepID=A0A9P4SE97_9PEZI|nr:hypothetical protein M501DRAFT_1002487 [Patellaria atrata CBS 101060]
MIKWADLSQTLRRPGPLVAGGPHPPAAMSQQQLQQQQQMEAQRRELIKRQSKKPTDKNIPDGVEELVIGDGVQRYRALRDVEKRLDAVMMRKRLDIQDSVNRTTKGYKTLRIWISNTAENQPWQQSGMNPDAFDFGSESQATYRVKIEGRLIDEDSTSNEKGKSADEKEKANGEAMDTTGDETKKPATPSHSSTIPERTKLSHFFKQITIDFDRSKSVQPDNFTSIDWTKPVPPRPNVPNPAPEANFDTLEFERKSDENINVTINLVRDEVPERYRLSKELAELLDTEEDDRAGVMMNIWNYVKAMGLQEDEETRRIHCDARLKAVFKSESLFFPYLPDAVLPHLTALPPLTLSYTIRVDKDYITMQPHPPATIYDIRVPATDPLRTLYLQQTHSPIYLSTLQTISTLDTQLAEAVQAIHDAKAKHAFFSSMARDPVGFVRRWTSSQRRDMEVILGEAVRGVGEEGTSEEWRRGGDAGVWGGEQAREGVGLWLARQKMH